MKLIIYFKNSLFLLVRCKSSSPMKSLELFKHLHRFVGKHICSYIIYRANLPWILIWLHFEHCLIIGMKWNEWIVYIFLLIYGIFGVIWLVTGSGKDTHTQIHTQIHTEKKINLLIGKSYLKNTRKWICLLFVSISWYLLYFFLI